MPVRLFVGNLPYETSEADLRQHFSAVGALSHVFLPVDRETGRPRGFAFVEFPDKAQADAAIVQLNSQPFKGRTLSVSEARARDDRPAGGPGGGFSRGPGGPPSGPRPEWSPRPPRPMGGAPGAPAAAGEGGRARNFGPDAPRRGKAKPTRRREEGPKGPIRVKAGGRIYAVDDFEDAEADANLDLLAKDADDILDPLATAAADAPDEADAADAADGPDQDGQDEGADDEK
jgi:RNA recognition motif-containing protein